MVVWGRFENGSCFRMYYSCWEVVPENRASVGKYVVVYIRMKCSFMFRDTRDRQTKRESVCLSVGACIIHMVVCVSACLSVCVCVCNTCGCVCVSVHACVYNTYGCVCVCVYLGRWVEGLCVHAYTCSIEHACVCVLMFVCARVYVYACACV